jgi:OmpA-OmpF porin, OOP family
MKIQLCASLLLMVVATAANAADFYAGAAFGRAGADDYKHYIGSNFDDGSFTSSSVDDSDTGRRLFIGASINPNISFEFGHVDFGKASTTAQSNGCCFYSPGPAYHKLTADGLELSAVGRLTIGERGAITVRIGRLDWDVEESIRDSGVAMVDGSGDGSDFFSAFGGEYRFAERLSIRGEYAFYSLEDFEVSLLSAALAFYFSKP